MKLLIVIPAFNESKVIRKVLKSIPRRIKGATIVEIAVINDGSTDHTYNEAVNSRVAVLNHILNRGAGAATKTGLELAKVKNTDVVITFDADGQHDPADILKVFEPVAKGAADVVIGSRLLKSQPMPKDRFILSKFASLATLFLFGVYSTDSQSGLRAFSKKALNTLDIKSDRMEYSSEILLEAKRHGLKIKEVPIRAIYTDYSMKKGQKNSNAIPIFLRFLVKLLR